MSFAEEGGCLGRALERLHRLIRVAVLSSFFFAAVADRKNCMKVNLINMHAPKS